MKRFFLVLLLLLLSRDISAQVVLDATGARSDTSVTTTSIVNFTSTGSNRAVIVFATCTGATIAAVSDVTYDGTSIVANVLWNVTHQSNFFRNAAFYAVNQSTTTNATITVTWASTCGDSHITAISMTGVHQTTPTNTVPTPTTGLSTAPTITATTAANELVTAQLVANGNGAGEIADGADQTLQRSSNANGAGKRLYTQAGASGGVMSATLTNNDVWTLGAVSFMAASAAAPRRPLGPIIMQ